MLFATSTVRPSDMLTSAESCTSLCLPSSESTQLFRFDCGTFRPTPIEFEDPKGISHIAAAGSDISVVVPGANKLNDKPHLTPYISESLYRLNCAIEAILTGATHFDGDDSLIAGKV